MQKYVPFRYSDLLFEIDKSRYELFDRCLGQNIEKVPTFRNRQKSIRVIRQIQKFDGTLKFRPTFRNRQKVDTSYLTDQKLDGTCKFQPIFRNRHFQIYTIFEN